ncbi:hypothetical protein GCM10010240_48650 [Streptomyces griseoviridis]|nr:hypothetical protein GCM10010240_48650 [Streptomyces griseoviridis]
MPHVRREFPHRVPVGSVLAYAWCPGTVPWVVRAVRSGGSAHVPVTEPFGRSARRAPSTCPWAGARAHTVFRGTGRLGALSRRSRWTPAPSCRPRVPVPPFHPGRGRTRS